jgi:hypothetical protein
MRYTLVRCKRSQTSAIRAVDGNSPLEYRNMLNWDWIAMTVPARTCTVLRLVMRELGLL